MECSWCLKQTNVSKTHNGKETTTFYFILFLLCGRDSALKRELGIKQKAAKLHVVK